MTETITPGGQPADGAPELSGVDLARIALHQARAAAKQRGDTVDRAPRRRRQQGVRREGREPAGFDAVLQGLMADRVWELPAAGASVLNQWPDIAAAISPRLPDHVQALAFHAESGQLDLCPDSPAYATQLRLISARIVAAVNQAAGTDAVRTIRVLPVGAAPEPRTTQSAPAAAAGPEVPVKTREMASEGFRQALAAHQAARPEQHVDTAIAQAAERQTRALRELSARAFPETASGDQPTFIEAARVQRRREAEAAHALALRRARTERAQRSGGAGTAQPPEDRRTA
ncbi:DciA family protein [Streptomyces sp. bgisy159]|uniref:DciA family protein n=1 Tax=Streptomyces sp. bgisy159 TaxID=3413795 RepID=UPI003F4A40AC